MAILKSLSKCHLGQTPFLLLKMSTLRLSRGDSLHEVGMLGKFNHTRRSLGLSLRRARQLKR